MNRPVTALFSALEALLVVAIGVGIPLVVLTSLWAFQYGLQIDWVVFWRAAVDSWLVGHGADLTVQLSADAAAATGIPGADAPIVVSLAALGFALLTVLMGIRAGRAAAETAHRVTGVLVTIGTFALLSLALAASAQHEFARPSLWQGTLLPALVYAVPVVAMAEVTRRRRGESADPVTGAVIGLLSRLPGQVTGIAAAGLRLGAVAASTVLAASSVIVSVLIVANYAEIITLYEGAHGGFLGGLALTIGQLALLPDVVVWAASWLVGPGFAIGTGSSISPLGTAVGPMPAIPFLGALPTADLTFGFVGLLVPVVAAYVCATLLRPRLQRMLAGHGVDDLVRRLVVAVVGGLVGGALLGLLAWAASGSAGPGRLTDVGPDPLLVGGFAALEFAVAGVLAMVVSPPRFAGDRAVTTRDGSDAKRHDDPVVDDTAPTGPVPVTTLRRDGDDTERIEGITR
ncbi:cell division protein PerM [Frigoribacterium sp. CFBP 8751]|uniref:cell division protein PerM n=1 Tax=Frigoribacterium sp. CFBP 8751 TaxID=2775277 RepID=UPI00201821D6|nr:DUF6350 family protein [Frigoribacterium sp. CFBP 8751]